MSWSARFLTDCRSRHLTPRFLLESVAIGSFTIEPCMLSSFRVDGYRRAIDPARSRISYGELQIPSWNRTATTVTIGLTQDLLDVIRPGQVFRLRVGFDGYDLDEFETVLPLVARGLTWSSGLWSLDMVDIGYSLQSRWVREAGESRLFDSLDGMGAQVFGTDYTAGDATIHTTSTAAFERRDGGSYLLRVHPDSGADPFWLTASGKTGTSFTGCSATGQYGTTAVDADASALSQVYGQALLDEHPLVTARRVLVSTGTVGGNGAWDTLPQSWSYGIPTELVAGGDIARHVDISSPASGSAAWDWVVQDAADDGQSTLGAFLAPGGFFVGVRQGEVTARAICDPDVVEPPDTWDLVDGEVMSYRPWDPTVIECQTVRFVWPTGAAYESTETEDLGTRPVFRQNRYDLPHTWSNRTAWGDSLNARLRPYLARVPERFTVRQPGWGVPASIGDMVRLTARVPKTRYDDRNDGIRNRKTTVVGGGPDWFRGETVLTLIAHDPSARST